MTTTEESIRVDLRTITEKVGCRAFLSANQENIASAGWTKVNLDSLTYDLGNNFDESVNYRFTAPVSGLYIIIGAVSFLDTSVIADKSYAVAVYKNNASISQAFVHASYAGYVSAKVADELFLKKDDYVELFVYTDAAGNAVDVYGEASGINTFLVVRLITKEGIRQ